MHNYPCDFFPASNARVPSHLSESILNDEIARQFREEARTKYFTQAHIIIMRTLWDEMIDKGSQLLPKDIRGLADRLTDELEQL